MMELTREIMQSIPPRTRSLSIIKLLGVLHVRFAADFMPQLQAMNLILLVHSDIIYPRS